MNPSQRRLRLDATRVDEVISDLTLVRDGARLFFAIDPSEIFDFCFPVSPTDGRAQHLDNPDIIADHQAALDDIFFERPEFPVLLPSYEPELFGLQRHLVAEMHNVHSGLDLVETLLLHSDMPEGRFPDIDTSEALLLVERAYNVLLAAMMGLYSTGITRFRKILEGRLAIDTLYPVEEVDEEIITQILDGYQETSLVDHICETLAKSRGKAQESEVRRAQRERADRADARAIDHLLYLNDALGQAFRGERLSRRYLVLYLSSAPKTESIFQIPAVQERLPAFSDTPHLLWRTRDQVFAYVARRGAVAAPVEEVLKHLNALRELLLKVEATPETRAECVSCVLNGRIPPAGCARADLCRSIYGLKQALLSDRQNESENLGLVSSIHRYSRLRAVHSGKKSHQDLIAFFRQLMDSDTFLERAARRMADLHDLMVAQAEFAERVPMLLTEAVGAGDLLSPEFYAGRDAVTAVVQHLPISPIIHSKEYRDIIRLLVGYYTTLPKDRVAAADTLIQAYNDYMARDRRTSGHNPEHELVRCLLYMGFPNTTADALAFDHARRYADWYLQTVKGTAATAREYHYVAIWAGRRARNFDQVDKLVRRAIKEYPDDPRFYHGRALNTFAWLKDARQAGSCPHTLRNAIDDARRAVTLYEGQPESQWRRDLVAVNYNNLARFYTQVEPRKPSDLYFARDYLEQLKGILDKGVWAPRYPEYFYTEALLELEEADLMEREGKAGDAVYEKLQNAAREIRIADELVKRHEYITLKERVQQRLAERSATPATV